MDPACVFGFYTQLLKQRGGTQVLGRDISPEMIRLATLQEQAEPLGIAYQVCDAVTLPQLGPFQPSAAEPRSEEPPSHRSGMGWPPALSEPFLSALADVRRTMRSTRPASPWWKS
jgi:hypothetical protein